MRGRRPTEVYRGTPMPPNHQVTDVVVSKEERASQRSLSSGWEVRQVLQLMTQGPGWPTTETLPHSSAATKIFLRGDGSVVPFGEEPVPNKESLTIGEGSACHCHPSCSHHCFPPRLDSPLLTDGSS